MSRLTITGVGETRNRLEKAVERSVPFTFMCHTITTLWYTINANPETQIAERRRNASEFLLPRRHIAADLLDAPFGWDTVSFSGCPSRGVHLALFENLDDGIAPAQIRHP